MRTRRPCAAPVPRPAFAGFRFPPDVIVVAVRWYLRFGLSYRDVEELLTERGVKVDHVTLYRWVQRFTPLLAEVARPCRHHVGDRWQVDETYVKVAGRWRYVYRAIDQFGQVIDVLVSSQRDAKAARRFFEQAMGTTKVTPVEVVTDKAATYSIALNELLPAAVLRRTVESALAAGIRVADEPVQQAGAPPDGHLQGVQDQLGAHAGGRPPAHDQPREHVDDERDVDRARPAGHIGEVADPQLVGPGGDEPPLDQIRSTVRDRVRDRGPVGLTPHNPGDAKGPHQPGHPVPPDRHAFTLELPPGLAGTVDPVVIGPHLEDFGAKLGIAHRSS
jgi:transposase-like protein